MSIQIRSRNIATVAAAFLLLNGLTINSHAAGGETTSVADIRSEMEEAADAIKAYSVDMRDETMAKVESILASTDARIAALEHRLDSKASEMTAAARKQSQETLRNLRVRRNQISEWYGGLKHSSADAWNHVKDGFLEAYRSIATGLKSAEQSF